MRKLIQTAVLSVLLAGPASSLPAWADAQCGELSWIDAINQALDANQALVAARQTLDAQQKDIAIARSTMLPGVVAAGQGIVSSSATFSSTAGVIPARTAQTAGAVTQTLYDQADIDALGAQKHLYQSQQNDYQSTRTQTVAIAGQDYLGVLLAEALLAVQRKNIELTRQSLEITESQEASGAVPFRDVLRWQSQVYADEQKMVTQGGNVLVTRFRLNQVRNRPAEETCILEDLTVQKDGFIFSSDIVVGAVSDDSKAAVARDYLVDLGLERSPRIRSFEARIRSQERSAKSARRWLIPSLDASLAGALFLKTSGDGADLQRDGERFWQTQATLEWDILSGGGSIAGMNQAKAKLESLRSQRNEAATALEESIRGTVAIAIASFENIRLSKLQMETAMKNYELVNEAYLAGEATFLELLDSQQQLLAAQTAAREALYGFLSDLLTVEQSINYFPFLEGDAEARIHALEGKLQLHQ